MVCLLSVLLFQAIRVQAAEDYFKEFYSLGEKKIVGKDMICSMCRQKHEELWGYVSIYNFLHLKNELAPIAGGMNKESSLELSVSRECASKLKSLKPIVDKYFSFKLCGLDYLLIPEVVGTNKPSSVMDMIVDLMVKQYSESPDAMLHLESRLGELKLGKRKKLIDSQSKEVFDYLSETGNYAAYTMLFYQRNNAEFKILSTIEDVFPSQFQAIFSAKERAESHEIFKELPGSDSRTTYDMEFRIDLIREFIPINHKIEGDFTKSFLEVTRNIFLQKPLSCDFMMSRFITIIRHKFVNDENFELSARKAYLVILFLTELGILDSSQSKDIMEVTMTGKYAEFFEEHKSFFNSYSKQYVFLTGVLTQYLLNIQKANTGATPFRKRLNGMKLDKALVNRILTEAIEKLKQYDKNYYQALEADIAELMIQAAEEKLTNDETSYVFTLGMTLSKRFKENYNSDNTELGGDND
jgi:CRISPR-associated protein Csh1